MKNMRDLTFLLAATSLALSSAHAQGSDTCTSAEVISSTGSFVFDNTTATTGVEGQDVCLDATGQTLLSNDLWFAWTAPTSAPFRFSTCGGTVIDTKIAVYAGTTCPTGALLGCNDDSCATQSTIDFTATAGQSYLLQLGNWSQSFPGSGIFTLAELPPPSTSDDCGAPELIQGVGGFFFDNTLATTGAEGQNELPCVDSSGFAAITRDLWFTWTAPTSESYRVTTCGGTTIDTKLAVYAGVGCPPGPSILGCNDDLCFQQSEVVFQTTMGSSYTIQLGNWQNSLPGSGAFFVESFTPPPPCGRDVGPDVIVGDLQEIENYAGSGGVDAISLGTVSCNIGTANLNWIASTSDHPAIGGNLYRYRVQDGVGRFEQIGMSWLKHGFFALSQNLCCPDCQATSGTQLGVGCSDPYTAGRNGSQFGLGPRWQVNAHTGAFAFPPANPAFTGTTARRLEFLSSDADTSAGVRYFGEAQYVTPDDAAAGNQNNNASHRELALDPSGTNFSLFGTTQREEPAILAWQSIDPAVQLAHVQVPGDGLFIVGSRVTPLPNGRYHYEYAVYNMNADRCGGSFSIPLSGGVSISNVGFHDVAYRNSDGAGGATNFSETDWSVTRIADALTWATETQQSNLNANALRWGTTYNFRFEASTAPVRGVATLGLWKKGTPGDMTFAVEVPASGPFVLECAGDGKTHACPCGNPSPIGGNDGCLNSLGLGGRLRASGVPSIANDTLLFTSSQVTNGPALYFQGSSLVNAPFGSGVRCAGGNLVRLGIVFAAGNGSSYPGALAPRIHESGFDAVGDERIYQAWFRDAGGFCAGSTFNFTNAVRVTWVP